MHTWTHKSKLVQTSTPQTEYANKQKLTLCYYDFHTKIYDIRSSPNHIKKNLYKPDCQTIHSIDIVVFMQLVMCSFDNSFFVQVHRLRDLGKHWSQGLLTVNEDVHQFIHVLFELQGSLCNAKKKMLNATVAGKPLQPKTLEPKWLRMQLCSHVHERMAQSLVAQTINPNREHISIGNMYGSIC